MIVFVVCLIFLMGMASFVVADIYNSLAFRYLGIVLSVLCTTIICVDAYRETKEKSNG